MACNEPLDFCQGRQMCQLSLRPKLSVRGEEPHPTRGDPVCTTHNESKRADLEKHSPISRCGCRAYGMNGSGLVCLKQPPLGYQVTSQLYCSLARHGGSAWWTIYYLFPPVLGSVWIPYAKKLKQGELHSWGLQ
jgi:hypothetical protein